MRLLDACLRKPVDATPVWLMRQAGRYLPEYRALREKLSFIELCRRPDVAAEVTLQPLARFELDAAIIFADILLPLEGMGIGFHFDAGDGPVIERPVRCPADLDGVRVGDPRTDTPYVLDALRLVARELGGRVPLIGFAGAPFTLASYVVEGGHSRQYTEVKKLMFDQPATFARLMDLLSDTVVAHLLAQIEAGAQVLQLFDSWAGSLSLADYTAHVAPASARALSHVTDLDVPVVHFGTGTGELLVAMRDVGADVIGVDYRIPLDEANRRLGGTVPLQGNIDPALLAAPWPILEAHVRDVVARGAAAPGHVVNLGHGVPPDTDPDVLTRIVSLVHGIAL